MNIDTSDTVRSLVKHLSGDYWIVEEASVWDDNDRCVGSRIIAAVGPLTLADLGEWQPAMGPTVAVFDTIDAAVNLEPDDAEWLQSEADAGRLTYPIGGR